NEIDEMVLPSLTEEHLKQLGVTALGHRVKLLDAIAALRAEGDVKAPSPRPFPQGNRLRRQVQRPSNKPRANAAISPLCSVIWWVRPKSLLGLMLRSGAIWSARIWMPPLQQ